MTEQEELINNLNLDYPHEIQAIAHVHADSLARDVFLQSLNDDTACIQYRDEHQKTQQKTLSFEALNMASITELMSTSMRALGKKPSWEKYRTFTVDNISQPSPNMLRLHLHCTHLLPENQAGFVCRFIIDPIEKKPSEQQLKQADSRPYTLRTIDNEHQTTVDIFDHGQTPGQQWARNLKAGQTIYSRAEAREKFPDFKVANTLLLADETSLPTVARLLEMRSSYFSDKTDVRLIIGLQNMLDQQYLSNALLQNTHVQWLNLNSKNQGKVVDAWIDSLNNTPFDAVWGGLESNTSKALKKHIWSLNEIPNKQCKIRSYW